MRSMTLALIGRVATAAEPVGDRQPHLTAGGEQAVRLEVGDAAVPVGTSATMRRDRG